MEYTISQADLDLIKAFITREANDYNPAKNKEWIDEVHKQITAVLKKYGNKATILKLYSLGNLGSIIRELKTDIEKSSAWDHEPYRESVLTISICPCGRISHLIKASINQQQCN